MRYHVWGEVTKDAAEDLISILKEQGGKIEDTIRECIGQTCFFALDPTSRSFKVIKIGPVKEGGFKVTHNIPKE